MAEPNIETPAATETPAAPPAKGASARREAALAVAISTPDPGEVPPVEETPVVAESATPPAVEPPKEEPKPETPDPLAARAAQDRYLMREREALKAEKEALAKERQEWESKSKELPDPTEVESRIHRKVAADLVSYADEQKWTPQQRHALAVALSW